MSILENAPKAARSADFKLLMFADREILSALVGKFSSRQAFALLSGWLGLCAGAG